MTFNEYIEAEYPNGGCGAALVRMLAALGIIMIGFFIITNATSCSTQKCFPQIEYITKDSIVTRWQTDSVVVKEKDSVFVKMGGDTVFVTRWKTVFKEHVSNKVDTIYLDKNIEVVQTQVERYVPQYYRWCSWIVWILIAVIVGRIAWWAVKKYYLRV